MEQRQFNRITLWQLKTFGPDQSVIAKLQHLREEISELEHDINEEADGKKSEWADCFILLFGAAFADGMGYDDICNAIDDKMQINYNRKWAPQKENGVINHVREIDPDLPLEWQIEPVRMIAPQSVDLYNRPPVPEIKEDLPGPIPLCKDCQTNLYDEDVRRSYKDILCRFCELQRPF